ncbi:hypothetical protein J2X20_001224 [Pelomonas saccharophila]|uniref:DUF2987 domain-containing protein n=1 Tax=Roseateles saccharophilus TaxID=304 RepID=A0ABU1YK69_ROSSA|nr:hypothetical protein [Roseateles saccharophilus]MDR7268595.1 hypothetical protein [Roseateles saccharophilus]
MRFLLACLLALATAAHAQTEVLPAVQTDLKRDKDVLPYARINELLTKFGKHGEGLFRMDFKVDAQKTTMAVTDVRLVVRSDEADHPIRIDGEGRFDLPVLPEAEAKTADLASNAGKGKLAVRGTIELTVPPEQLTLAKVRQVVRVARTLREELLPWYLRWLFPRIEAVRVCSATPDWQLQWSENGQLLGLPLAVAAGERDPEAGKAEAGRPCTLLSGQENWPDAARLVAPAGTKLSIKF